MDGTTRAPRRRALLFIAIVASCVISSLQATALSTALPPMIADLGVSVGAGQWLTSGYNLAMGIAMPLTAYLVTRIPTKRLYLASIVLFAAGTAVSALAGDFAAMMVGRVVLPGSLAMAVVSPLAGRLYDRMGMRPLLVGGSVLMVVGFAGMAVLPADAPLWAPATLNAVRTLAVGCVMMPLVTWGVGGLATSEATASASALLTSLRTEAGAIGSAVFVGVMDAFGGVADTAGEVAASMHGVNVAFAGMAAVTVALLVLGVARTGRRAAA